MAYGNTNYLPCPGAFPDCDLVKLDTTTGIVNHTLVVSRSGITELQGDSPCSDLNKTHYSFCNHMHLHSLMLLTGICLSNPWWGCSGKCLLEEMLVIWYKTLRCSDSVGWFLLQLLFSAHRFLNCLNLTFSSYIFSFEEVYVQEYFMAWWPWYFLQCVYIWNFEADEDPVRKSWIRILRLDYPKSRLSRTEFQFCKICYCKFL